MQPAVDQQSSTTGKYIQHPEKTYIDVAVNYERILDDTRLEQTKLFNGHIGDVKQLLTSRFSTQLPKDLKDAGMLPTLDQFKRQCEIAFDTLTSTSVGAGSSGAAGTPTPRLKRVGSEADLSGKLPAGASSASHAKPVADTSSDRGGGCCRLSDTATCCTPKQ